MSTPAQCPECGRFLSRGFVEGLAGSPSPCPKCEALLGAVLLDGELVIGATGETAEVAPAMDPADVLAGWDPDGPPPVLVDGPGVSSQVVAAGAGIGAVVGALFLRRSRVAGGVLGAALGAAAAAFRASR